MVSRRSGKHTLESAMEVRCCDTALKHKCITLKFGGFVAGAPDRIFMLPGGKFWLVEFKAPGGVVSPRQQYQFNRLAKIGHSVSVIWGYEDFREQLYLRLGRTPPPRKPPLDMI